MLLTRGGQIANDVVSDHESTGMCMDSILFIFSRKQLRSAAWDLVLSVPFCSISTEDSSPCAVVLPVTNAGALH